MVFSLIAKDSSCRARTGTLTIGERTLRTPFFMPVSTKATIKHVTFDQLGRLGTPCVIMNAFLLSLRPGTSVVKKAGGLHSFTKYSGVIATDSGGFQVLSDTFVADKNDDGVFFRNPYNGQVELFRPEDSTIVQQDLGSDIAMVLDDQPPFTQDRALVVGAVERTLRWAQRCLEVHHSNRERTNTSQLLFAIGQGGIFTDVREYCAKELIKHNFDGFAVGGLAIGEPPEKMRTAIATQTAIFPENKPRYVMGLGSPVDILEAVALGVDMFDSIFPTKSARRGTLFTSKGILRIGRKEYRDDFTLVDEQNPLLRGLTKAYLNHLLRVEEATGMQLASLQNLWFMQWFVEQMQQHIEAGTFSQFRTDFVKMWG